MIVGRRWHFMVALFVIEAAAIVVVSNLPFFPGEQAAFESVSNSIAPILKESALGQVASIFAQNFMVAIRLLVPVIGPLNFALTIYVTARVLEVIGITSQEGVAGALATLYLLPHTYLELPAYAVAVTESGYLLRAIYAGFKGRLTVLTREIRFLFVSIVLIAGILIVAAVFEVTEGQIAVLTAPPAPPGEEALVFLTWIPFAAVFAGTVSFWKRARREAPELEAKEAEESRRRAESLLGVGGPAPPQLREEKDGAGSPTSGEEGATA
jgi:uncharacterized membrane protein SpoIIM required for sporulation